MTSDDALVSPRSSGSPSTARLRVVAAGPLVTVQDGGREGHMRFGVARSGPMDAAAHAAANVAVGNAVDAAVIEVSRGGVEIEVVDEPVTVAVTGGDAVVGVTGRPVDHWNVVRLGVGDRLSIRQGAWGSWSYLAVAGGVLVDPWLGSASTHSTSGLGGRVLTAGDEVDVPTVDVPDERLGEIPAFDEADPGRPIRVVIGPQHRHFGDEHVTTLTSAVYRLSDAYDRMGVRLDGPALVPEHALSIPSEPIVRGSIQVSGDGVPTVLLADHQTTGGYPKVAAVVSADLDRFAQLRAGDEVRFEAVTPQEAVAAARARLAALDAHAETLAGPGRTLAHRLRAANLVSGVVTVGV